MSRNYPLCADIIVDAAYFLKMQLFLTGHNLTPEEAQVIWETGSYRQHHIDIKTLEKKMPKRLRRSGTYEHLVKDLVANNRGFLEIYFKKDVLCFRCTPLGFDVTKEMTENCYSSAMEKYYELEEEFADSQKKIPYNPNRWIKGQVIKSNNNGEEINIKINNIHRSDKECGKSGDFILHETIIEIEIYGCPKCKSRIVKEYSFNLDNFYLDPIEINCLNCGHVFKIYRYLWTFN